jgi:hypothetical protein
MNEETSVSKGQALSRYILALVAASVLLVVIALLALPGAAYAKKHQKVDFAKGTNVMLANSDSPLINFYGRSAP